MQKCSIKCYNRERVLALGLLAGNILVDKWEDPLYKYVLYY